MVSAGSLATVVLMTGWIALALILRRRPMVVRVAALVMALCTLTLVNRSLAAPPPDSAVQQRAAWATVQKALPPGAPTYRLSWLPSGFKRAAVSASIATAGGGAAQYAVSYTAAVDGAALTFRFDHGFTPPARPSWSVPLRLGPAGARLLAYPGQPELAVAWPGAGGTFAVQAQHVRLDDLLRIVTSMRKMSSIRQ